MDKGQNIYTDKFYKNQKDGSLTAAQFICPFICNLFPNIKSVIDFGCGTGSFLSVFAEMGKTILGLDYGAGAIENLFIPKSNFLTANLSCEIYTLEKFDLCLSLEVAEHIEEKFADIFISNLARSANIILFSAAIPKQGGTNHINEQWPSYWAKKFSSRNFIAIDILRTIFWKNINIPWWYRQNMILFIKKGYKLNVDLNGYTNLHCLPIIIPKYL